MNRPTIWVLLVVFSFIEPTAAIKSSPLETKLHRVAGPADSQFGYNIDLEGNLAVIAAINRGGRAFLYDVAKGSLIREYTVGDGKQAGHSVAMEGSVVGVGRSSEDVFQRLPGSVYLFDRDSGQLKHRLSATDEDGLNGFGSSVDIDDGRVLVGAGGAVTDGQLTGAAYVFDAATGQQIHKLASPERDPHDFIGFDVAMDRTVGIVGAPQDGQMGTWAGAAFLFDISTGMQIGKLFAQDGKANDRFGEAVDIDGHLAIVGAPALETGANGLGAAYVFDIATGNQLLKLKGNATTASFGRDVAIHGNIALVSGLTRTEFGDSATSTYLFDLDTGNVLAEITRGDLNSTDIVAGHGVALNSRFALIGTQSNSVYVFAVPEPDRGYWFLIGLLACARYMRKPFGVLSHSDACGT
jgi:outer membrane protein assembly factor BamB